jgi:hypothetical protein
MITKRDLLDLQENYDVNLVKFIDSFFEEQIARENNLERHELLVKIYSEGWGDTIQKWTDKAGSFIGKLGKGVANTVGNVYKSGKEAGDNYGQGFFKNLAQGWNQGNQSDPEQVATQAIEMLKNAGLLADPNLQKMMQNVVDQAKKQKQMAQAKTGDMSAVDWSKFQGQNNPIQANRPMGGASGTGAFGRNPVKASENFNLNFYGFTQILESSRYAGDPVRMKAKYPGTDMNGKAFKKGDEVTYYPRSKKMISGPEGEQAYRDFLSAAADEDAYRGMGGPYAS